METKRPARKPAATITPAQALGQFVSMTSGVIHATAACGMNRNRLVANATISPADVANWERMNLALVACARCH